MSQHNERVYFLDNARSLVVLFVAALHAACAYAGLIVWWPVREPVPGMDLVILFFDFFCMPALFLIAGYFAPISLRRHGFGQFLRGKLRRLGAPLVLLAMFYLPLAAYIGYWTRTANPKGFLDFWLYQLSTAWKPEIELINTMEKVFSTINDFSLSHLWFINLLLVYFLLFALVARCFPALLRRAERPAKLRGALGAIALTMFVAVSSMALVNMATASWSWIRLGGYLLFQPTRLVFYASFFALGAVSERGRWFESTGVPGPLWLWLGLALLSDVGFILLSGRFMAVVGPYPAPLALADAVLRALAALGWTFALLKAALRWGNKPRALFINLSRNSYDIYLLHLPIIIALQFVATFQPLNLFLKSILVGTLGVGVSWLLADRFVRPFPKAATAALLALFLAVCLVLN